MYKKPSTNIINMLHSNKDEKKQIQINTIRKNNFYTVK